MAKRRGLGRGLDALLSSSEMLMDEGEAEAVDVSTVAVDRVVRGRFQPRRTFDDESLQELAESIRAQGVVQPIVVRPVGDSFELVAGERRWRAAQLAGVHDVPALVRDLDDQACAVIGLIENIQRQDLNALEEAEALVRLSADFGLTHQEVANAVGRSRTAVSNLMRLVELEDEIKQLLGSGRLEMGHARALLGADRDSRVALARRIVSAGLSVRQAEALVRANPARSRSGKPAGSKDPDIASLEQRLGDKLGASVAVSHRASGSGSLTIRYHSLEELEGILAHIT